MNLVQFQLNKNLINLNAEEARINQEQAQLDSELKNLENFKKQQSALVEQKLQEYRKALKSGNPIKANLAIIEAEKAKQRISQAVQRQQQIENIKNRNKVSLATIKNAQNAHNNALKQGNEQSIVAVPSTNTLKPDTSQQVKKYNDEQNRRLQQIKENDNNTRKEVNVHRQQYVTTNRFYVEMESSISASFSECSGLGVNIKKETYLEGGVNDQQKVILGHAEFSDITLKRGMTDNLIFWNWVTATLLGIPNMRRNINILLFNQAGETMQCWTLVGAIPISWKAPSLQADSSSVAIEEITLAYEGLKIINNAGGGGATVDIKRDALGFFPYN